MLFSLASGRPPKAMRHLIETFGIDVPVAGFNGGTLVNPDGSILVAHHLPAEAALITLALFSAEPDVEVGYLPMATGCAVIRPGPWCSAKPMAWATGRWWWRVSSRT